MRCLADIKQTHKAQVGPATYGEVQQDPNWRGLRVRKTAAAADEDEESASDDEEVDSEDDESEDYLGSSHSQHSQSCSESPTRIRRTIVRT